MKVIYLVALATSLIAGTSLVLFQRSAEVSRVKIARETGDFSSQVINQLADKFGEFTFGWLNPGAERRNTVEELQAAASGDEENSRRCAWIIAASFAIAVLASFALPVENRRRFLAGPILGCWILGMSLPVLTIKVATRLDHLGTIVIREESKSFCAIIGNLASESDFLMLLLVGFFSLGIPLVKIVSYTLPPDWHAAHKFGTALAKWSLSEVLVVGLVVIFLGMTRDAETDASLQLGFWFFASSAILSMLIGMMIVGPISTKKYE